MAEQFELGFVVDTTQLLAAKKAVDDLATASGGLAAQEGRRTASATQAATATGSVAEATQRAAVQADRYIQSLRMEESASRAFKSAQEALNRAVSDGRIDQQQYAAASKQVEDQLRRAQQAAQAYRTAVDGAGPGFADRMAGLAAQARSATAEIGALRGALGGQGGGGVLGGLEAAGGAAGRLTAILGTKAGIIGGVTLGVVALGAAWFKTSQTLGAYQDKQQQLEGRLTNSLGSVNAAREAMDALRTSTQETGLGFDAAADAFARIARNNDAIGLTQAEMLRLVETTQKLGAVSGASAGEMQAGMIQFGQAIASGRLQGDELRSIMENFPALAKAIAENFEATDGKIGVSIGTLRRLGSEGELTGSKIADAVLRATEKTNKEYEKLPMTMERANQKLADSFNKMLGDMGRYFGSSGFVQSVYEFLNNVTAKVGGIFSEGNVRAQRQERISELEGNLQGFGNFLPGFQTRAGAEAELAQLRAAEAKAEADARKQAREERLKGILADANAASGLVTDNLGQVGKDRQFRGNLKQFENAIAATEQAIALGGNEANTVEDLKAQLSDLRIARDNFVKTRNKQVAGLSKDISALTRMQRDAAMAAEAESIGGGGGGTQLVLDAMQSRETDAGQARAGGLQSYLDAAVQKRARDIETEAAALRRRTEEQRASNAVIGASAEVVDELQIKQQIANYQFERFGTLTGPAITRAMDAYSKAVRDNAKAMNEAAGAQARLNAEREATLQFRMLGANGDPRAEAKARLDTEIEDLRRDWRGSPADLEATIDARRRSADYGERRDQNAMRRELDEREEMSEAELRFSTLGTDEYEKQLRLLQRSQDLKRRGYKEGEAFYESQMAREEELLDKERERQRLSARNRNIVQTFERSAMQAGEAFTDLFSDMFTSGTGKALDNFGSSFKRIAADMGRTMVYEIAIRPMQELLTQLARVAAQKLITSLFGGFTSTPTFANGGAFGGGGSLMAFSEGGAFTNRIVDRPTLFAFSGGTGLMGEAGPEAIMPLKRGPNGKLGVYAQGGGGETQVVINDMRTVAGAEQVETRESRGPDGRRLMQVFIRDEVRRQMRGGELDKDMQANYGQRRVLARR